jgi:hypothetical protein
MRVLKLGPPPIRKSSRSQPIAKAHRQAMHMQHDPIESA